jgi:uncharacterized RDD family membrane protein YckC
MANLNPYAAPADEAQLGPLGHRGPTGDAPLAGRWARLGSSIIDGLLSMVVVLPLQAHFGVYDGFPNIKPLSAVDTAAWGAGGFALWLAIHAYFLATRGQTVGKRLVGIQIINEDDGRQASFVKLVFARYLPVSLIAHIPILGGLLNLVDVLLIFREDRRCFHDLLAGTRVVEYRAPESP